MRSIFGLAFACAVPSNERPKTHMISRIKKRWQAIAAVFSLLGSLLFAVLVSGCADVYYVEANTTRTPEARYNTYYAPDYYPYYPWYSYYGGAYYYGE
jgi:hypothetical protein